MILLMEKSDDRQNRTDIDIQGRQADSDADEHGHPAHHTHDHLSH